MTIELRQGHWVLFAALTSTQFFGLWMSLRHTPLGPAVRDFFAHSGWFTPVIPLSWMIGSAFTTTLVIAKLSEVFVKPQS